MPPSYQKTYTGPATPVTYDPAWQTYTNLSPTQIAIFQAFPQDLVKYARNKRWQVEISNLTLPNGIQLDMSDTSQRKIAGLKQAFDNGALTGTVPFVAMDGVHQVDAAAVTAVYDACVARVQGTYTVLATLLAGINATPQTITTRAQVDAAFA